MYLKNKFVVFSFSETSSSRSRAEFRYQSLRFKTRNSTACILLYYIDNTRSLYESSLLRVSKKLYHVSNSCVSILVFATNRRIDFTTLYNAC